MTSPALNFSLARLVGGMAALAIGALLASPARAGLEHWYKFDEGGGMTAGDSVGNADGALSGDAALTANGLELNLGGANRDGLVSLLTSATDAVNGIDIASFEGLRVELWATPSSSLNDGFSTAVGFGKVNTTDPNLAAEYFLLQTHRGDNRSQTALSLSDDGDPWTEEDFATGPELNDDQPHHYVAAVNEGRITLWVDGVQTGSTVLGANSLANVSNEFAWVGDAYPVDQNWAGVIRDLKIYNVPEPAVVALLGVAGIALAARRRRYA